MNNLGGSENSKLTIITLNFRSNIIVQSYDKLKEKVQALSLSRINQIKNIERERETCLIPD